MTKTKRARLALKRYYHTKARKAASKSFKRSQPCDIARTSKLSPRLTHFRERGTRAGFIGLYEKISRSITSYNDSPSCYYCGDRAVVRRQCIARQHPHREKAVRMSNALAVDFIYRHIEQDGITLREPGVLSCLFSSDTRFMVTSFLSALMEVIGASYRQRTRLMFHLQEASYSVHVSRKTMQTDEEIWPPWYRPDRASIFANEIRIGLITDLNDVDGFGVASVRTDEYGNPMMLTIWCYPHYEVHQFHFPFTKPELDTLAFQYYSPYDLYPNLFSSNKRFKWHDFRHGNKTLRESDRPTKPLFVPPFGMPHMESIPLPSQSHHAATRNNTPRMALRRAACGTGQGVRREHKGAVHHKGFEKATTPRTQSDMTICSSVPTLPLIYGRRQLALWKEGPGSTKTWKRIKVIKISKEWTSSLQLKSSVGSDYKPNVVAIPSYQIESQGWCTSRPVHFVPTTPRRFPRISKGDLRRWIEDTLPSVRQRYDSNNSLSETHNACISRADQTVGLPTDLRQLIAQARPPLAKKHGIFDDVFHGLVIPPYYFILETLRVETHFRKFRATHLNDNHQRYEVTCMDIGKMASALERSKVMTYRLNYIRKLRAKSTYLDTIVHHECLYIIETCHEQVAMQSATTKPSKAARLALKRGSKEFTNAFPRLPRPTDRTLNAPLTQSEPEFGSTLISKAEKKREAQRRRRARKRASKHVQDNATGSLKNEITIQSEVFLSAGQESAY